MAICWRNYIHAEVIFTYAHPEQQMWKQDFKLDITESEDKIIYNVIKSMFDTKQEYIGE